MNAAITAPERRTPGRKSALEREIIASQDAALEVACAHDSVATSWSNVRIADGNHDACLAEARRCIARGEYARADHWIAQAQHYDKIEDQLVLRIWTAFSSAAEACRIVVRRIEHVLGMRKALPRTVNQLGLDFDGGQP